MTDIEKMELTSMDIADEKRQQLKQLFPEVFTEGKVDIEKLKTVLGDMVETGRERYSMNWSGKSDCMKIIQQPSIGTLKPSRDESINFDETQNVFIEGDNLETLKLLQKSYFGKVKMIYIDPPYNTGKDFIYPDNYTETLETYLQYTEQIDSHGRKYSTNAETSGRFHTKWLNMMYPRLYLSRNLLSEDGILFVSINDYEYDNLTKILNEIYGEENHLATFVWINEGNIDNQSKIKRNHEYIIAFAKNELCFQHPPIIDPNIPNTSKLFRDVIENTIVKNGPKNPVSDIVLPIGFPANFLNGKILPKENYWPAISCPIEVENGKTKNEVILSSGWSSKDLLLDYINNGFNPLSDAKGQETSFYLTNTGAVYVSKVRSESQSHVLTALNNMGTVQAEAKKLEEIGIVFDYPKPRELLEYLICIGSSDDSLILDFFSGSCGIAHAVFIANLKHSSKRRFICVQLPEPCKDDSEEFRRGFRTVAEIGKKRIIATIDEMEKSNTDKIGINNNVLDMGVRIFKLDKSNFKIWDGTSPAPNDPTAIEKQLDLHIDHIDPSSTPEDILYELLLKAGYELTTKVEKIMMDKKTVYSVSDGALLICLESELTKELIKDMANKEPVRVICLDEGFKDNDQLKTNAVQIMRSREIEFRTV